MARGSEIIVFPIPDETRFEECIVSGTPKPGTIMEVKATVAPINGRLTYQASTRTTGAKGGIAVLLPDYLRGRLAVGALLTPGGNTPGDAYVDGDRGFIYWPEAGDELNLIVASVAGTADDVAIGDLFGVEQTSGKLKANSSYGSAPFQALEVITDPTADYLLWVKYLGNQA